MLSKVEGRWSKVEVHPTFDTAFYKILNAIGDIMWKDLLS